jgi:hypothetical protein
MGTLVFQATLGGAVNIIGPNIASTINFTLPSADGTSGQTWTTNGSGVLAFGTLGIAGGGTGQITATAAFNALAPSQTGNSGRYLTTDGTNTSWAVNAGGDVVGPSSATDNALARFDTTTGKLIQNSVGILSDAGVLTGLTGITSSGSITFSGLTSGRVPYASTGGLLTDSANLTFNGTTLTANTLNLTNALGTGYGGTGLTSFTANGVVYASSSSVLATASALQFDGSNLLVGSSTQNGFRMGVVTASAASTTRNALQLSDYTTTDINFTLNNSVGGIFVGNGHSLAFGYNNTTEAMRLTSTGLGIGTSSPAYKLDVNGTANISGIITASATGGYFANNGATTSGKYISIANTGGTAQIGVESSAGGTQIVGSSAYMTAITGKVGIGFSGNDGSALHMTLNTSGNLGLGVTPSAWSGIKALQVGGGNALMFTSANAYGQFYMLNNAYYNGSNYIYQYTQAAASYVQNQGAHQWLNAASGTAGTAISFTQAMTLSAAGDLLVGATATGGSERLNVTKDIAATEVARFYPTNTTDPYGLLVYYLNANPNGTSNEFFGCYSSGGTKRMTVQSNGGIANYAANNVILSDRREKTNFAPATSYLDKICAIPVQTFNYIDQNLEEDGGLTLGVVAQDVQSIAPELVMESNWGNKEDPKMRLSIYQTDLQYALMKCIQEQQTMIESLKARLDAANL